ncbi:MAG: FprA family A-type flavoprotein [Synergistales bacterium]|nr:FprA family A-type flavoprotein [Synergistales bacterium]
MKSRKITERVQWMGAIDWDRRLFDSLIPLPDGTSYNAYLVMGSDKIALIDTVDPAKVDILFEQLKEIPRIDYVISLHSEQDHSGSIPFVLDRYPDAQLICSSKARELLLEHLSIQEERIRVVEEGEKISLGDLSLTFLYTPWVHWPETMVAFLPEEKILFTCDLFGSHLATSDLYAGSDPYVCEAAKRYYAEIMMPFRTIVQKNLDKISDLDYEVIAPSHGPIYDKPDYILESYRDWVSERVSNKVVIPYISMHGSTAKMVDHLVSALVERDIKVERFELSTTDLGKLAMALVDAATIVIGTPTVHFGPHPIVFSITQLANALRPKARYAGIIGSYGWGTKAVEQISGLIPNLKVDVLGTVMCKGYPREEDLRSLEELADAIKEKHSTLQEGN